MRPKFAAFAAALALAPAAFAQTQQQPALPTCNAPEHRAFDFWIGEWDVYVTGTDTLAGRNSIRSEHGGCVITETWASARANFSGRSVNLYDRETGLWEQVWVDSTGDITHFAGGPYEGGMRLTDPADRNAGSETPIHTRMTFIRNADGTVRQHGESSSDGVAWTTRYDFTYRRRAQ